MKSDTVAEVADRLQSEYAGWLRCTDCGGPAEFTPNLHLECLDCGRRTSKPLDRQRSLKG